MLLLFFIAKGVYASIVESIKALSEDGDLVTTIDWSVIIKLINCFDVDIVYAKLVYMITFVETIW